MVRGEGTLALVQLGHTCTSRQGGCLPLCLLATLRENWYRIFTKILHIEDTYFKTWLPLNFRSHPQLDCEDPKSERKPQLPAVD